MFAVQIRPDVLSTLRSTYTPGTEVELVSMTDPYREMKPGLRGVVDLVDNAGGIHVSWNNGSGVYSAVMRPRARSFMATSPEF